MAWKLTAAPYCLLLFLALALLHTEASRPLPSMLDLDDETTLAKSRFEAGDPVCRRFQFRYECSDGVPPSSHTSSTQEPAAADRVLPEDIVYPQDPSDCGPVGRHKYRCVPPKKTTAKTPAPEEAAAVVVQDAQVVPEHPSDCGPLGKHKYRCVPPKKTPIKTPAPPEASSVGPAVATEEAHEPAPSTSGPSNQHEDRCAPPMHKLL